MHDLPVAGHERVADDFVLSSRDRADRFLQQVEQEGGDVPRKHLAGVMRRLSRADSPVR